MGVHIVLCMPVSSQFYFYIKKHFFLQLQDSHVLLLRQLFWFTIDHMVHSSCLKNTEKPGRSLAVTDKVSGRELAGKVLSDITFAHYAN